MEITNIERTKTGQGAKTPGCRMYIVDVKVVEPKKLAGGTVRDWITVGTADDPLAKRPESWSGRTESGPGRLKRLLVRSGTPLSDDDEEWMEAAVGKQVVAPINLVFDDSATARNKLGLFFRPSDEDCPDIGVSPEQPTAAGGGKSGKKAKGATAAGKRARSRQPVEEDDEETERKEKPKGKKGKPKPEEVEEEEEEDEEPKPTSRKPSDEDDEDDEEEDD